MTLVLFVLAFTQVGAAEDVVILDGTALTRVVPTSFYFEGQSGPTQMRNSVAVRFGEKHHVMGGYRVQGNTAESAEELREDALALERAGAFAIVLEGITQEVASDVTRSLHSPSIGIGAGPFCDGQILVSEDLLGLGFTKKPKFARAYANLNQVISGIVSTFKRDCQTGQFPAEHESYILEAKQDSASR